MSYLEDSNFTQESIINKRDFLGKVDPTLLEKTIYALELVGQLAMLKLNFVFKGGTSLLLLDSSFKRLSIDVDIITENNEELIPFFNQVVSLSPFTRWEEQIRGESPVPKNHYRFYFESQINHRMDYVLLDVLQTNPHPGIEDREVVHPLFSVKKPVSVRVPSLNSITADKLTALAPETTGINFGKGKSLQLIKQLFDLGDLTLKDLQLTKVSKAYAEIAKKEISYCLRPVTVNEVLDDTINVAYLICQLDLKGSIEDERTADIRQGIRQISSFITQQRFSLPEAKVAASRIAFLASVIKKNQTIIDWKKNLYDRGKDNIVATVTLPEPFHRLNRLKTIIPESFYYWARITENN
ncbi:MAG: nucleotidyl transferase AbiEii/AbiGii toxin family protein [FCB group bacterium]|nr:nucleotidyl transferase AbiEii/AbiGii toxin family protein [FCB group bacterium]